MIQVSGSSLWLAHLLRQMRLKTPLPVEVIGRVGRRLFRPEQQPSHPFVIDVHGFTYRGDFADYIDWHFFFFNQHEPEILALLRGAARARPTVFLDIGANSGTHSAMLARDCEAVHAFEPVPAFAARIAGRLEDNAISNVTIQTVALGEAAGQAPYYAPVTNNQGTGSFIEPERSGASNAAEPVMLEIARGDDYLPAAGVGRVDLIKIDVEGFEYPALSGLRETLERDRPLVVFEIGDSSKAMCDGAEAFAATFPEGYVFYHVRARDAHFGRHEAVLEPCTARDLFSRPYANYFAAPQELTELVHGFARIET